jgi:hypothetical protein
VLINHFYTLEEANFRYGLLALLLTLRFRAEQGFLRASVEPLPPLVSLPLR